MRDLSHASVLHRLKLLHTLVWAFFVTCIVAIPLAAWREAYTLAAVLSGLVWIESAVLAMNHWRCPITDVAGNFTQDRSDNFDIYLPLWLARYNKWIFGVLFVIVEAFALACWVLR